MSEKKTVKSNGISFTGLLTILFIGLKLGKVITWSWIWVLSPIWISLAIGLGFFIIAGILFLIAKLLD
jgi:hypothetical protein